SEPESQKAILDAISDKDEAVQRAALAAVEKTRPTNAVVSVTQLLSSSKEWPARVRAAEALGVIAAGSRDKKAADALAKAAEKDDTALVREAAVVALAKVDPETGKSVAARVATKDAEPRVRAAAKATEKR